jgi:hypothetical protein
LRKPFAILILLVAATQPAFAADSIAAIVANPAKYDGKTVDVRGTVSGLREKTSAKDNAYDTFKLCSTSCVSVFIFGRPAVSDGAAAEVHGTFSAVHRVGSYTFYNEIEAVSVK